MLCVSNCANCLDAKNICKCIQNTPEMYYAIHSVLQWWWIKKQQTYVRAVAQPTVRLEQSGAALKQKSGIVAKEWSRFLPPQAAALMRVANIISSNQTIVM